MGKQPINFTENTSPIGTDFLAGQKVSGVFKLSLDRIGDYASNDLNLKAATEKTVSAGVLTVTQSLHKVQPESGTSDEITGIAGLDDGQTTILFVSDVGTDKFYMTHSATLVCPGARSFVWSNGLLLATRIGNVVQLLASEGVSSEIHLFGASITPSITTGCAFPAPVEMTTNKNVFSAPAFDKDAIEYGQYSFVMPQDYDGGTITASIHWTHPATTTNFKTSWSVQAVAIADDGALDVAYGTKQTVNDTGGTTYDYYISPESAAITIAGTPVAGKRVNVRVFREATDGTNDTLAVDAYLLEVVFTYKRK